MTNETPEHPRQLRNDGPHSSFWLDEPRWSDQRIRAAALELAIKTSEGRHATLSTRAMADPVLDLAYRYRAFISGDDEHGETPMNLTT
jgi:hypothetical protein